MDKPVQRELRRQAKIEGLADLGRVFLPRSRQKVWKHDGEYEAEESRMMFPGYLFVHCRFSPRIFHLVNSTEGTIGLLNDPRYPTPMETWEACLALIQNQDRQIAEKAKIDEKAKAKTREDYGHNWTPKRFKVSSSVKIKHGPWTGFDGVIESVTETEYKVTMQLMGKPVILPFTESQLEKP